MGSQTFFPDDGVPATPFNTNATYDAAAVGMASTIQGLSQRNARMWQIIAIVSMCYALFVGTYEILRPRPQTVPVVVTVDTQGQATYVGKIDTSYWGKDKIPEIAKTYQIKKLIANMYTWVIDRNAQQGYINECAAISQGAAITMLDKFFIENNPFSFIGLETQTVDIEEPLRQTDKTYVVYYNVITRRDGRDYKHRRFSALITLDFYQEIPESNPLGIFITSFDIKEVQQ